MAYFITRVELHDAKTWADYDRLHTAMAARGFSRTISTSAGAKNLPTAEYYHADTASTQQILDKAKSAASSIGKAAAILVSHVANGLVDGLSAAA